MRPVLEKVVTPPDSSMRVFLRAERQYAFEWHHHRECELTLILSGRGKRFVGDHVADYGPGDLVLLGSNLPHTWRSLRDGGKRMQRALVVQFSESICAGDASRSPELRPLARLLEKARRGLRFAGRCQALAAREMGTLSKCKGIHRLARLMLILDQLAACSDAQVLASRAAWPAVLESGSQTLKPAAAGFVADIIRRIHDEYAEEMSQAELARQSGVAPATLSRAFRAATGVTFVDYVNDVRVGHACRMLLETGASITRICFDAGFSNVSNFNRAFKRRRGMSPRAFRGAFP